MNAPFLIMNACFLIKGVNSAIDLEKKIKKIYSGPLPILK